MILQVHLGFRHGLAEPNSILYILRPVVQRLALDYLRVCVDSAWGEYSQSLSGVSWICLESS